MTGWLPWLLNKDISPTDGTFLNEICREIIAFRARYRVPPLTRSELLDEKCQHWSGEMARKGLSHDPSGGWEVIERVSQTYTANEVVQIWENSPAHRAILLGNFSSLGIGGSTNKSIFLCVRFI